MARPEPIPAAFDLLTTRLPDALAAFLGGSAPTARRTATSDLDIVVVLPGPPAPYRETVRHRDWPAELFVHTETSLRHYWGLDAAERRAVLVRMCAEGVLLVSVDGVGEAIQAEARALYAQGPRPASEDEVATKRYLLTDLLDDFRDCTDPSERAFIGATLLLAAGELALLLDGTWLSRGKWLPRRLDERTRADLVAGHGSPDKADLERAVLAVLERAGGPLTEGYRIGGTEPG